MVDTSLIFNSLGLLKRSKARISEQVGEKSLRICIISQYFPPDASGASTRVSNAVRVLLKHGHQVLVVTSVPHYPYGRIPKEYRNKAFFIEETDKVKVIRVWVPPLPHQGAMRLIMYLSFSLSSLLVLPLTHGTKLIWAVSPNYFSALPGILYKLADRAPLVLDVVDIWPEALVNLHVVKSKLLTMVLSFGAVLSYIVSDRIITLNQRLKNEILKHQINPAKIVIIENSVDLDVFRPLRVEKPSFLLNKFVVMYSGNLGPMYDFGATLQAAVRLQSSSEILFVLRGSGESARYISQRVKDLRLNNVLLLEDNLTIPQIAIYLNYANVLLLPMKKMSDSEISHPLKLSEYLACGKPVICLASGETANIIRESGGGILVEPGDSSALAETVLKLHQERAAVEVLGENARHFAEKHYSLDTMGDKLQTLFENQANDRTPLARYSNLLNPAG